MSVLDARGWSRHAIDNAIRAYDANTETVRWDELRKSCIETTRSWTEWLIYFIVPSGGSIAHTKKWKRHRRWLREVRRKNYGSARVFAEPEKST